MKKVKVTLSKEGLKELSQKIDNLKKDLKQADNKIKNRLADFAENQINMNLSATPFKDGNDDTYTFKEDSDEKMKVGMRGSQVLYNEFGTGTEGEQSPHEEKGKFALNPYNNRNGTTIRQNNKENSDATKNGIPVGGLYWTYMDNGTKRYTQGIPAGKQVFDAAMSLRNEKKKIVKEEVSDALSKL